MIGLKYVGVSRAVPLAATYPLFSLIWATTLLHQPLSIVEIFGAIIIVFGIWLLSREKNHKDVGVKGGLVFIGIAVSLVTAVVWSVSISMMNVAVENVTSLGANYAIVTLRIASVALFFILLAPFIDKEKGFIKMKRNTVIALCVGGLVANGVGWLLLNYSFLNTSLTRATVISSTSPLFASIAGFTLLHEKMTTKAMLGAAAIVAGICLIFIL
jgi:drug/metabolite transporter (DMT)-like permease